jgi:predicted transcriptional regulator
MRDLAKMLGINTMAIHAYQSEKNMVTRSLEKIDEFRKDIKYYEQELTERENQSEKYIKELPE